MNIIGLTGGIACGKTTASNFFSHLKVPIIDADIINRELLLPKHLGYEAILKAFPDVPILADNSLDKTYLRNKIYNHKKYKQELEKILHPLIKDEIYIQLKELDKYLHPYCIISVPLMIEANFKHLITTLWVCDCSEDTQIKRLMIRDKITQSDATLIMTHQLSRQERLQHANQVIPTENRSKMEEKIKYLHLEQIKLNSL